MVARSIWNDGAIYTGQIIFFLTFPRLFCSCYLVLLWLVYVLYGSHCIIYQFSSRLLRQYRKNWWVKDLAYVGWWWGKATRQMWCCTLKLEFCQLLQWRACKLFFAVGSLGGKEEVKPGDPVSKQCLKTDKTKFIGSQKKSVLQKCSDRHIKIVHDTEQACFCKNACNSTISRQVH